MKDQEARSSKREESQRERLDRLENMVYAQHEKLDRLEELVYRVIHRDRVTFDKVSESPCYEEQYPTGHHQAAALPNSENGEPAPYSTDEISPPSKSSPAETANLYPIASM
jgi:hypothetical protein